MDNNWFHGKSEESQRTLRAFDYLWDFIEEHSENPDEDLELFQELCWLINGGKAKPFSPLIMSLFLHRKQERVSRMVKE